VGGRRAQALSQAGIEIRDIEKADRFSPATRLFIYWLDMRSQSHVPACKVRYGEDRGSVSTIGRFPQPGQFRLPVLTESLNKPRRTSASADETGGNDVCSAPGIGPGPRARSNRRAPENCVICQWPASKSWTDTVTSRIALPDPERTGRAFGSAALCRRCSISRKRRMPAARGAAGIPCDQRLTSWR